MQLHDRMLDHLAHIRLEELYREAERVRALSLGARAIALRNRLATALRSLATRLEREPRSSILS